MKRLYKLLAGQDAPVRKRYRRYAPVKKPVQIPGLELQQQMEAKKKALKRIKS